MIQRGIGIQKGLLSKTPFDLTISREAEYEAIDEKEVKDFLRNRPIKLKVDVPKISIKDFLVKTIKVVRKENGKLKPTNAIAHRDYTYRWAPIMFSIFDDRIEISSPGGLLPGLNIKRLEGHHTIRNKSICNIFHETKDMEKFGTGIGKMKINNRKLTTPQSPERLHQIHLRHYAAVWKGWGEVIQIMVKVINPEVGNTVYDSCYGIGKILRHPLNTALHKPCGLC